MPFELMPTSKMAVCLIRLTCEEPHHLAVFMRLLSNSLPPLLISAVGNALACREERARDLCPLCDSAMQSHVRAKRGAVVARQTDRIDRALHQYRIQVQWNGLVVVHTFQ